MTVLLNTALNIVLVTFLVTSVSSLPRNDSRRFYQKSTSSLQFQSEKHKFLDAAAAGQVENLTDVSHTVYNSSFGGVYQTCNSSLTELGDLCDKLNHKNPLTGNFSCSELYSPVHLRSAQLIEKNCTDDCDCFGEVCKEVCFKSVATYEAFWCAAMKQVSENSSGLMFGGLYSTTVVNPYTGDRTCPSTFIPVGFLWDVHVCVGNDYTAQSQYKFGGFFSCTNGNPLSSDKFAADTIADPFPHACPE